MFKADYLLAALYTTTIDKFVTGKIGCVCMRKREMFFWFVYIDLTNAMVYVQTLCFLMG